MDCYKISLTSNIELECCNDGTTVLVDSKKVSFSPVVDPKCGVITSSAVQSREVMREQGGWPIFVVGIGIASLILFVIGRVLFKFVRNRVNQS